ASPEEEAEHACIMGPSGRLIDEKQPAAAVRETIRREMADAFAAYAKRGGISLPSTVLLVAAQRTQKIARVARLPALSWWFRWLGAAAAWLSCFCMAAAILSAAGLA